jgi:hypothetical protein
VRILRVFERNTSDVRIIVFITNQFFAGTIMLDQNNTPLPPEEELKFQMQAMTQMIERMNFVMGNVCEKLGRVERCGKKVGTSTQDVRKVRAEPKQTVAVGLKGQGGLIMRILRRPLMILVMVVLRMRP